MMRASLLWPAVAATALAGCFKPGVCSSPLLRQSKSGSDDGAPAVAWDEPVQVASGDAHRGPWRMNESDWRFVDDPTVAMNDSGVVAIAWADHARQDIVLQVFEPSGERRFDEPVNISRSPSVFSWLPRLELSSGDAGTVYVVWQEIVFSGGSHGGEILFSRSTDGGARFEKPLNLSDTTAGAGKGRLTADRWQNGSFDLVRNAEGMLYAAWTEYEGRLFFRRSEDDGKSFAETVQLARGDEIGEPPARGPSLAASTNGAVHIAWTVGGDPAADIRLASSADGGRSFGQVTLVAPGDSHADAPQLALDSRGTLHLVYAAGDEGPLRAYDIRYTRRAREDAGWTASRSITGAHADKLASVHFPTLTIDAEDQLNVLWELYPRLRERPRGLGFSRSAAGGEAFADPMVVPGSNAPKLGFNGSQQGLFMRKLAVNERGEVAVVNSTFAPGRASHIWLYRARHAP